MCGKVEIVAVHLMDGAEFPCSACDTGLVVRGDGERRVVELMDSDDGDAWTVPNMDIETVALSGLEDAHEPCPEHCGGAE